MEKMKVIRSVKADELGPAHAFSARTPGPAVRGTRMLHNTVKAELYDSGRWRAEEMKAGDDSVSCLQGLED